MLSKIRAISRMERCCPCNSGLLHGSPSPALGTPLSEMPEGGRQAGDGQFSIGATGSV